MVVWPCDNPLRHDGVVLPSTELFSRTWQARADLPSVVLLHGSGQEENTLLAFAQAACPGHTITAVRGRIHWEGGFAFFRRGLDRTLDEADLAHVAAAIQRLLGRLQAVGQRPPILLGYSNGAIAAAAAILSDRRLSTGAILLRPLSPLPERAFPRLEGYPILLVSGEDDARRDPSDGPSLEGQFRAAGAAATLVVLPVGHGLTTADEDAVISWLRDFSNQSSAT
jgi:phospholipase/carboxylesterase